MNTTKIIWTILPYGTIKDGKQQSQRVSVVVSPQLKGAPVLHEFPEFLDWPETIKSAKFSAEVAGKTIPLKLISKPDSELWRKLFDENTPVNSFVYRDLSSVKLRSYSIRNILRHLKDSYAKMALESPCELPRLLPWSEAHPGLKDMLEKVGTKVESYTEGRREYKRLIPGFDRFFGEKKEDEIKDNFFGMNVRVPKPSVQNEGLPEMDSRDLNVMNPDWDGTGDFSTAREYDLYQADRFYRRFRPTVADMKRRPDFPTRHRPKTPEFDFHRIVASMADYPALMRRLGLVLDFVLTENITDMERPRYEDRLVSRLRLRINWSNQHDPAVDATPWTAFISGEGRFMTRPRTTDHKDGLLNLCNADDGDTSARPSPSPYDVYQVDPDGAALKTVNFTITSQNLIGAHFSAPGRKDGSLTYTTGDRQGLAALRSGGLGVSRHGRAVQVATDLAAMKLKNAAIEDGDDITLFTEDVLSGYRVDVADEQKPGAWRSLCVRDGKYSLTKYPEYNWDESDEGYVSGPSTTSEIPTAGRTNSGDHYLHESLFRWTGWSLCAPRPGRSLKAKQMDDGSNIQSEEMTDKQDEVVNGGSGVSAAITAKKGSLPRLRYGHSYRIRARIVDLAGNSLAVNDPLLDALTGASNAVGYWRFEPIDPPVVVHRTRVSEGESLERMVIRSNYDASTEAYLDREPFKSAIAKSKDFDYGAVNERHFVPPKSSQLQCETHGLFDRYFVANVGDSRWKLIKDGYEIAAHEEGTLYDVPKRLEDDPDCPIKLITPSALNDIATKKEGKPELPSPENPVGDRMVGGQYVIHGEAQIDTPWLPDGAAGGTAIRVAEAYEKLLGLDSFNLVNGNGFRLGPSCVIQKMQNEHIILIANGGYWPESKGFRLILAERKAKIDSLNCEEDFADDGKPVWVENEKERVLKFFLPKGRIARLLYSSFADKGFINSFGIPEWVERVARDARLKISVQESALYGANWLITPFREMTLVHATQAPVFRPRFNYLELKRTQGSHDVKLHSEIKDNTGIKLHGPSTGKFEIEANWKEWVDDLTKPGPERITFSGQLGEIRLTAENHANHFNLKEAVDAQLPPPPPDATPGPQQRADVHALGDTRFRLIEYRIRATTRFREYLPPSIYDDPKVDPEEILERVTQVGPVATGESMLLPPENDPGAPILCDPAGNNQQSRVLSTAPPDDPKVLYVVPTLRWRENKPADGHDVTRYGNGLRVWLDRPWFSSGDGELLGVVIFKNENKDGLFENIPVDFQPLVTQWGADPFWKGSLQTPRATETDFPAQVASERLKLQENSTNEVTVIGHRVHWDEEPRGRGLWYCDIALDPLTTYMPFVRLALVRYQPNALPGAKISKVVLTDFAQVLPRRRATVKVTGDKITAALRGPVPELGPIEGEFRNYTGSGEFPGYYSPEVKLEDRSRSRNRVELVLQTRPWAIDSDLAWEDAAILAEDIARGSGDSDKWIVPTPAKTQVAGDQPFAERIDTRYDGNLVRTATEPANDASRDGRLVRTAVEFEKTVDLGNLQIVPGSNVGSQLQLMDMDIDPFWQATATLPKAENNSPRRLMLREFERFYSDDVRTETSTSQRAALPKRRVIEERLVFADIIPL